jgi:ribosomal protein L40E
MRRDLRLLEKRSLDVKQMIALGEQLSSIIFPATVRSYLSGSLARLREDEGLRIRLRLDTYTMADVPWEYAYISKPEVKPEQKGAEGFLALNRQISIVRYELLPIARSVLTPLGNQPRLRLVAILADPQNSPDYPPLNLTAELDKIKSALAKLSFLDPFYYPDAKVETLHEAILDGTHIFHFAGHGKFECDMAQAYGSHEGRGYLVLLDDEGKPFEYRVDKLARMLNGRGLRLAVLGACEGGRRDQVNAWTGIVPALAGVGIPAVVGMQYTIRDVNAIHFSTMFYKTLAACKTIDEAVYEGRLAIISNSRSDNERDWGVPVLYLRTDEGLLFPGLATPGVQQSNRFDPARRNVSVVMSPSIMGAEGLREVYSQPLEEQTTISEAVTSARVTEAEVSTNSYYSQLLQLYSYLSEDDLRTLCFNLDLEYESLSGSGTSSKARELILYYRRRKKTPVLLAQSRRDRPDVHWPADPPEEMNGRTPADNGMVAPQPAVENNQSREIAPCSNCGAQLSASAKFCEQCGTSVPRRCTDCGAVVPPHTNFCGQCGKAVA